jgi:hypothetical protein
MPLVIMIPAPTPTLTPLPTATATTPPVLPTATTIAPTATLPAVTPVCEGVANANAPNSPIAITTVNKAGNPETVTITNVSAGTIDLSGWWICSMLGHQLHAVLSGTIAPGQSLVIPSQAGGPIWNNTSTDPAALYRRDGVQIGYRTQ